MQSNTTQQNTTHQIQWEMLCVKFTSSRPFAGVAKRQRVGLGSSLCQSLWIKEFPLLDCVPSCPRTVIWQCHWLSKVLTYGTSMIYFLGHYRIYRLIWGLGFGVLSSLTVWLWAWHQDGWCLEFASPLLRADKDVAMVAVQSDAAALEFVSEALRKDPGTVIALALPQSLARVRSSPSKCAKFTIFKVTIHIYL